MTLCNSHPWHTGPQEDMLSWAHNLPKIDLHRHFEGSLRLDTILEIAAAQDIPLNIHNPQALCSKVQISQRAQNFCGFLEIFDFLRLFFTSRALIQRITREIIEDAARDNVRYLELRVNPLAIAEACAFELDAVVEWIEEAIEIEQAVTGTRTCLIIQIPRQESLATANRLIDIAIAHMGKLVRGVDLAGNEQPYPSDVFIVPFQRAYEAGLSITIHAGETAGARAIVTAINHLHAQRIGHGLSAVTDIAVLELLREKGTFLEICPTSNIKTNLIQDYAHHPLAVMDRNGLTVTINTDDPSIFITTSSQEIVTVVSKIGVPVDHIYRYLRNSVEGAFIPEDERPWLRNVIGDALSAVPGALPVYNGAAR